MSKNQKKFWSTVAAVMTGIGTFIAAIPPLVNMFKPETQTQSTKSIPLPSPEISVKSTPKTGVRFFCGTGEYKGRNVPATIIQNTQSNEEVIVIFWRLDNDYFGEDYPPQKRCEIVSQQFQNIYNRDGLKFVVATKETWVPDREIPVVCSVKYKGASCKNDDLLFTLESKDDPNLVLKDLINNDDIPSEKPPLSRGEKPPKTFAEGKRVYYNLSNIFNKQQSEESYQYKLPF
ncbi:COP23 domain-containing protein [Okeania sp. KiyG1]|uniref:COP23 domain-containing protein n=1 Tax=Okeania sp. KiyG1 TaxID=2720165 RepID=UPI00198D1760|nr:COP23 domain-containing protein [Okeania sp. KiyG1]GGA57730.1 hypothetical protein CYANOKiyG1_78840 [Okeania sp. KiyG1]